MRWPSATAIGFGAAVAAVAVGVDAYFSSRAGYLSHPSDYDGAGYMLLAASSYRALFGLHLHAAAGHLLMIAPGWNAALAVNFALLGVGGWQAFLVRFWGVALLVVLVYWIVRRRAPASVAVAAAIATALLPMVSAGVRSSSWELISTQANYYENFGLDDLRPDILAIALVLWSLAVVAEHIDAPRRATFLVSGAFIAAAVLVKPSTSPLVLLLWGAALAAAWLWSRRRRELLFDEAIGVAFAAVLLAPWATAGRGVQSLIDYLYASAVTFRAGYVTNDPLPERMTYILVRIPTDLGQVEAWLVIAVAVLLVVAMARRRLAHAEIVYAAAVIVMYLVYSLPTSRNSHLPMYVSASLWLFAWAGAARLLTARLRLGTPRASRLLVAAVAGYALVVYAAGAFALAAWPAAESSSNAQLTAVTAGVAAELRAHVPPTGCFAFAPGPGWPASLQLLLMDGQGRYPASTHTDIDISTPIADYVATARQCEAVIAYRQSMDQVGQAFVISPAYRPYLQAVADWVRSPGSGYSLDRSWTMSNLAPFGAHTLGRYDGITLTVDVYVRGSTP